MEKISGKSDDIARVLLLYLVNAIPPVSIDALSALAGVPAVKVLSEMERLKKERLVKEKRGAERGFYSSFNEEVAQRVLRESTREEQERILKNILDYYGRILADGTEKTLVLAEIHYKLQEKGKGLTFIKDAADILSRSGNKGKATLYYGYLLNNMNEERLTKESAADFLERTMAHLNGNNVQAAQKSILLHKAHDVACKYEKWDYAARTKLAIAQILKESGKPNEAFQYYNEICELAEKTGNHEMLRSAVLSVSNFLFWEGRVGEAIKRYEEVLGNIEEFGEDVDSLKVSAMLGWCYVMCGRVSRGLGMIDAVRSKASALKVQEAVIHADLMNALSFIEIRKLTESESCLERITVLPEEKLEQYVLWSVYGALSYLCCVRKEYEKAFAHLGKAAAYAGALPIERHRGSHVFESMLQLEQKGLRHDLMNCDAEVKKILQSDDLYMRGVALRYRAIKKIRLRESKGRAFLDLRASEKQLSEAGAEIELARTRIALGDAYLKEGEINVALSYLEKAWAVFSRIDKNLFPKDLLVIMMPQEQKVELMLDRIVDINEMLGTAGNKPMFLERVISVTMDFTTAMRGAFFVVEPGNEPRIIAARNLDPMLVRAEEFKRIREIVLMVHQSGRELIIPGTGAQGPISDESLQKMGIHSLICMPAKLGEHTHGCLYLDNSITGKAFADNQLPYVRLLCSQIAVGLSNIKIYEQMKELKDRFEEEAIFYKREMGIAAPTEMIVGDSEQIRRVLEQVRQVAPTDSSVLINGETGVGKELIAKAIHTLSKRKDGPFIPVNLAALPQDLVASELFGHEKGAFTGAHEKHKGRFELAHGGTIFLDEIGDLPLNVQVKLLRVLQEGSFEPLGSTKQVHSDFRVIAATNKDLHREIERGLFRHDLFYRLNVFPIDVPALRDRTEDIPLLAWHFIEIFGKKIGKRFMRPGGDSFKRLAQYSWPGNVRELEHYIERAVILSNGGRMHFPSLDDKTTTVNMLGDAMPATPLADFERGYVEKILNATHWRISGRNGAAAILGLKPTTLISRMKKLGIKRPVATDLLK